MSEVLGDWMEHSLSLAASQEKDDARKEALQFAQLYEVFEQDKRAVALLKHWVSAVEQRDISPSATHQEYAYWEGRRAFIRGIQRQIEFAKTERFAQNRQ